MFGSWNGTQSFMFYFQHSLLIGHIHVSLFKYMHLIWHLVVLILKLLRPKLKYATQEP